MLWEPLSSILLVSRSKVIVFSSAMGDLYSYFHFWYEDKKITNSNAYFNQKWLRATTFLLFHLVFCSLIFKMSNQQSQKREKSWKAGLASDSWWQHPKVGRKGQDGQYKNVLRRVDLTLYHIPLFFFFTTLHDDLIKTQTLENWNTEY